MRSSVSSSMTAWVSRTIAQLRLKLVSGRWIGRYGPRSAPSSQP